MPSVAAAVPVRQRAARPYRSVQREQQARRTRQRILAAATDQFLATGYGPTTMRGVAAAAGVSVPTVELAFGNKAQLLKAAIDAAIAGDDEPVPVLQRDWAARAQTAATVQDFLAAVGEVLVDAMRRAAGLVVAAFEAALVDPSMRALSEQLARQRSTTVAWIVDGIMQRSSLRSQLDRDLAIDTLWLLMDPVVFCRLTRDRGWTSERFERWFTDSVARLLLPVHRELGSDHAPTGGTTACRRPTPEEQGAQPMPTPQAPRLPAALTSIQPQLSVRRGRAAIDFYAAAFGAVDEYRVGGTDEKEAVVAQLAVGGARFWVADEAPAYANHSPESLGGATTRLLLIVDDPQSTLHNAVAAGATEVRRVSEEYGWLLGRIADPFGHHWEIGKPLQAWPPRSAAEAAGRSASREQV